MAWLEHYPDPHRIYVGRKTKRHVHHFWHGIWMIGVGVALVWSDWKDKPWSFSDDRHKYPRKNLRPRV